MWSYGDPEVDPGLLAMIEERTGAKFRVEARSNELTGQRRPPISAIRRRPMDEHAWEPPDMSRYEAHRKQLRRLVLGIAFAEARRLELSAVGPDAILLAILHPDAGDTIAAQVLRENGLDRERFERRLDRVRSPSDRPDGPQLNPGAYQLTAMAEGIAAALGAETITAEHVLLAAIWDPSFYRGDLMAESPSREQLRLALAAHGFALPQAQLPPRNPRRLGPPFFLPKAEMERAVRQLRHVLPEGASFGCNHTPGTNEAYIRVDEGLDAERYVLLALARDAEL
jgi:hypothetical protein